MGGFLKSMLDSKASKLWLSGLKIFVLFEKQLGDTRLHYCSMSDFILCIHIGSSLTFLLHLRCFEAEGDSNFWQLLEEVHPLYVYKSS